MFLPTFSDIDVARRARLLLIILLTFLVVAIVLSISSVIVPSMLPMLPIALTFAVTMCVLLGTLRLGYVLVTSASLVGAMIAVRLGALALPAVAAMPGVEITLILDSAIIILLAAFLFAWWSTLPVALTIVAGQIGLQMFVDVADIQGDVLTAVTLIAFCVFASLFARSLEGALSYARQQEMKAQQAVTHTQALNQELETTLHDTQALLNQERTLRDTISQLTVPIQQVGDGVLFAPLIGHIDLQRGEQISKAVLDQIHSTRAHTLIVDVQGISVVDSGVVTLLDRLIQAAQLLGARVMMTGVTAAMAATMTRLGITFRKVSLHATVADALHIATEHTAHAVGSMVVTHSSNGMHH